MSDLQKIIKSLVQQCNIESISTKDLTQELTKLYQSVETLENKLDLLTRSYDTRGKALDHASEELRKFQETFVTPVDKIAADRKLLDEERFRFNTEREFASREVLIYRELLASLTCVVGKTINRYEPSGSSYSENMTVDKPNLPQPPFSKK